MVKNFLRKLISHEYGKQSEWYVNAVLLAVAVGSAMANISEKNWAIATCLVAALFFYVRIMNALDNPQKESFPKEARQLKKLLYVGFALIPLAALAPVLI